MEKQLHLTCKSCAAELEVGEKQRTAICPYCASPSVIERPEAPNRPSPLFVVGFKVIREKASEIMREWAWKQNFSFRRSGLSQAPVEKVMGIYVPAYLYSAQADTDYVAEIGEKYTVREGKNTKTKTEWRNLHGRHSTYVSDILVTASKGINNVILEALEPYDFRELRRYRPGLIAGWIAEDPSLTEKQCLKLAHAETVCKLHGKIKQFMPGDTSRLKDCDTRVSQEVIELIFVPVWSFAIKYHPAKPPIRVLVNGQTGKVWAKAPVSWLKISIVASIFFIIIIIMIILLLSARGF